MEEALKKAPALHQMMKDMKREEEELLAHLERVLPVVVCNNPTEENEVSPEGLEHRNAESTQPVSFPINFDDDLSINLCIDGHERSAMLLNRNVSIAHDKITPDQMVGKAYSNLFREIEKSISISMIDEKMGVVTGCNGFEASLVLINEIWKLVTDNVGSKEIVFGIPAHDYFIFTAAGNNDYVEVMREKIRIVSEDPNHAGKITDRLYIMHADGKTEIYQ